MYSWFSLKSSIDVMCLVSKIHTDPVPAPTRKLNCGLSPMVYASFVGPTPACHELLIHILKKKLTKINTYNNHELNLKLITINHKLSHMNHMQFCINHREKHLRMNAICMLK